MSDTTQRKLLVEVETRLKQSDAFKKLADDAKKYADATQQHMARAAEQANKMSQGFAQAGSALGGLVRGAAVLSQGAEPLEKLLKVFMLASAGIETFKSLKDTIVGIGAGLQGLVGRMQAFGAAARTAAAAAATIGVAGRVGSAVAGRALGAVGASTAEQLGDRALLGGAQGVGSVAVQRVLAGRAAQAAPAAATPAAAAPAAGMGWGGMALGALGGLGAIVGVGSIGLGVAAAATGGESWNSIARWTNTGGIREAEARTARMQAAQRRERELYLATGIGSELPTVAMEAGLRNQAADRERALREQLAVQRDIVAGAPSRATGSIAERLYGQQVDSYQQAMGQVRFDRPETVRAAMGQYGALVGAFNRQAPGSAGSREALRMGQLEAGRTAADAAGASARFEAERSARGRRLELAQEFAQINTAATGYDVFVPGRGGGRGTTRRAQSVEELANAQQRAMGGISRQELERRLNSASNLDPSNALLQRYFRAQRSQRDMGDNGVMGETDFQNLQRLRDEANQRNIQAQQQLVQLTRQQREAEIGRLDNLRGIAEQSERFYQSQARAMREQMQGQRSGFGLMEVEDQERALDVARRLSRGERLDTEDLQFARGVGALSPFTQAYGEREANRTGIIDQLQALGLGPGQQSQAQQLRQAEGLAGQFGQVRAQLENRIQAEIRINEQSLAQQINQQVTPAIQQAINNSQQQLVQQLMTALRQMMQQQVQNAPPGGGG